MRNNIFMYFYIFFFQSSLALSPAPILGDATNCVPGHSIVNIKKKKMTIIKKREN